MIGFIVLVTLGYRQYPGPLFEYLCDDSPWHRKKNPKVNDEPIFLTYIGGDPPPQKQFPRHWKAAQNIRLFVQWKSIFDLNYTRGTVIAGKDFLNPWKVPSARVVPRNLDRIRRIDSEGNTIINRLLMAHIVVEEEPLLRAFRELKRRNVLSMRANKLGQTPLMLAVESGWPSLVDEVLKLKPDLSVRDKEGNDVLDYLVHSPTRIDERYLANRIIWTHETICQSLLDYATPNQLKLMKPKAVAFLKTIREDNGSGIVP